MHMKKLMAWLTGISITGLILTLGVMGVKIFTRYTPDELIVMAYVTAGFWAALMACLIYWRFKKKVS